MTSDPFMAEIERQAREAQEKSKAKAKASLREKPYKYNPVVGTDPETGGLIVNVDIPDNAGTDVIIESMLEAARKAGLG